MSCENLNAIKIVKWKIGKSPYNFNSVMNFVQGDKNTNILEIVLDSECGDFEGLSITAIIQVPGNPSVNLIAVIEEGNVARYTLPQEVLHYVGSYTVNFMITQTQELVRWSENVKIYNVIENLSVNNLPLLVPEEEQKYLDLIADLNAENTRAETNLPLIEAENARAESNIIAAGDINTELEGTIADAGTAKTELEGAITDSETAKSNLEQTITDSETAKTNLEGTITAAGQAQSDLQDKIDEVPALIQSITDEGDTQVARVISEGDTQEARVNNQGDTEVARVQAQGDTSVQAVKDQETASIIAVGDKGDEEYQRLNDLIQTSPTGGNAILLDGRTRTSFEEDIESRQYALDNRLVYAFEPGKRNIENLKYGMYVSNPLTNGDGTIKSEDADSMAGVFDDDNGSFYCGEGYVAGSEPAGAPIVKESAPDGKLIIKEPWTSATHSFIFVGGKYKALSNNIYMFYICNNGGSDTTNERAFISSGSDTLTYDSIISSLFAKSIDNLGSEGNVTISSQGVTTGDINFTYSNSLVNSGSVNINSIFVYEGNLTEQELRDELAKIKSGQYYIENTGVYEPVPQSKRRANEYGHIKDYVMVSSVNTDIQLVETDKVVYTELYDGTQQRARIDNAGVITGAGVVDVNGYIRLSAAPGGPVKVVIENV